MAQCVFISGRSSTELTNKALLKCSNDGLKQTLPIRRGIRHGSALTALWSCCFQVSLSLLQNFLDVKNSNLVVCKPVTHQNHVRSLQNSRSLHTFDFSKYEVEPNVHIIHTYAYLHTHTQNIFKTS